LALVFETRRSTYVAGIGNPDLELFAFEAFKPTVQLKVTHFLTEKMMVRIMYFRRLAPDVLASLVEVRHCGSGFRGRRASSRSGGSSQESEFWINILKRRIIVRPVVRAAPRVASATTPIALLAQLFETERIELAERVSRHIRKGVESARDRIALEITANCRIVIPEVVVTLPGL
jgi:hypothetical protein